MSSDRILYIKGDRDIEVTKPDVTLGDILSMECADKTVLPRIKALRIVKLKKKNRTAEVRDLNLENHRTDP